MQASQPQTERTSIAGLSLDRDNRCVYRRGAGRANDEDMACFLEMPAPHPQKLVIDRSAWESPRKTFGVKCMIDRLQMIDPDVDRAIAVPVSARKSGDPRALDSVTGTALPA